MLTPYRLYAALGTFLALVLLIAWGRHGYTLADQWRDRSALEAANHRHTKANYRAAQLVATARAEAARIETERRSTALAKEADHANEEAALWADRARRYADAGGMRAQAGTCSDGAPGRAGAAGQADPAARGDGPGAVTLSRADFDTLTANTDRLIRVHDWGERLIAEGLAVKAGE
jgi:hypothetical protein